MQSALTLCFKPPNPVGQVLLTGNGRLGDALPEMDTSTTYYRLYSTLSTRILATSISELIPAEFQLVSHSSTALALCCIASVFEWEVANPRFFFLIPRNYLLFVFLPHRQMVRQGLFLLQFFPATFYRGAGIRTHIMSVSGVAPDLDL